MSEDRILTGKEFYSKLKSLKQVSEANENWEIFHIDEVSGEKWIEEVLFPEMHGGGIPQLRLIEKFPWE